MLVIEIPGELRGKGRPRFARVGNGVRAFTDAKTRTEEEWLKAHALRAHRGPPMLGALKVVVDLRMAVPASWTQKRRAEALAGRIRPTVKPDLDNVLKLLDAWNGLIWEDDSQIAEAHISRHYALTPRALFTIEHAA